MMRSDAISLIMLTFRRATAADAPALSEFACRLFTQVFGPDNTPADMALYLPGAFSPELQAREIGDPTRICLLGEADVDGVRTLASYALLHVGTRDAAVTGPDPVEIERFYVDFPWHGGGAAQAMMTEVFEQARAAGGKTIWLGVWERNPRAIRFYGKHQFVDVGAHPFVLGTDVQVDRVMSRPL